MTFAWQYWPRQIIKAGLGGQGLSRFSARLSGLFNFDGLAQDETPLRILFCGADAFSVSSLQALHQYAESSRGHVASIDVATKTDKRVGRGYKQISSPPIKSAAQGLGLQVHQFDTFTGWSLPASAQINMIVAVSFGLKIPSRILNACEFGGLNVHPSLLPDLKGASPVESAIIHGYRETGVTTQTLHPTRFDEGRILAQTSPLTIPEPDHITAKELRGILAPVGARQLVQVIRKRVFLDETEHEVKPNHGAVLRHAPRLTPAARQVNFHTMSATHVTRLNRAIPKLWFMARRSADDQDGIRVILEDNMRLAQPSDLAGLPVEVLNEMDTGTPFCFVARRQELAPSKAPLLFKTVENEVLVVAEVTVAGSKRTSGAAAAANTKLIAELIIGDSVKIGKLYQPLFTG